MSGSTPIGSPAARPAPAPDETAETAPTGAAAAPAEAQLGTPELANNGTLQALARGEGPALGQGSRGEPVRLVQDALVRLGHPLPRFGADGDFGRETAGAVKGFQRANGLPETGQVDQATLKAIDEKLTPPDPDTLASRDAQAAMAVAARDGTVEGNELQQAEAKIAEKYGEAKAKEVMRTALGVHVDKLDMAAVDYANGRYGSPEGHTARYQELLTEHIKGAKLLDANFDGKLDENDKIFTKDASGKINVQNVGEALRDKVKIQKAMADASEEMGKAGHEFAVIKDHEANPAFFTVDKPTGTFKLKPGVKPSDAVKDIFANPDKYKFECATAMVIVYYKAMLETLGPKDFDRIAGDLEIGPWNYENDLARNLQISGTQADAGPDFQASLRTGDYSYINTPDVSDDARRRGWQGENVIYLGNGKYYGHPFGVADSKTIVDYLNTERKTGSTRSAGLIDLRGQLSPAILREDLDPNG